MYKYLRANEAAANRCSAMEADTILKHGRNPKSQMSRGKIFIITGIIAPMLLCMVIMLGITACEKEKKGEQLNGTYLPRNEVAAAMSYQKFVFSGNKVQVYLGVCGIPMGSFEYSYTLNGNTLTIKEDAASVELTYIKYNDKGKIKEEISILSGFLETEGAVWYNEKYSENYNFCDVPNCFGEYEIPAPEVTAPERVDPGSQCIISWKEIPCASEYKVDWTFHGSDGSMIQDNGEWMVKRDFTIKTPDKCGYFRFHVQAKDDHKEGRYTTELVNVSFDYSSKFQGNINNNVNYNNISKQKYGSSDLLVLLIQGIYFSNYSYEKQTNGDLKVSFTAHNRLNCYGKVTVNNSFGDEIESILIEPYSGNITSLRSYWNGLGELYKDFGSFFSGDWIGLNAKETPITVTIPECGFLTITNSAYFDEVIFVCNVISLISNSISVVSDVPDVIFKTYSPEAFSKVFNIENTKLIKDLLLLAGEKYFQDGNVSHDLISEILDQSIKFYRSDEFLIIMKDILLDVAINFLIAGIQELIEQASGGILTAVFAVEKFAEIRDQIVSISTTKEDGYVIITNH